MVQRPCRSAPQNGFRDSDANGTPTRIRVASGTPIERVSRVRSSARITPAREVESRRAETTGETCAVAPLGHPAGRPRSAKRPGGPAILQGRQGNLPPPSPRHGSVREDGTELVSWSRAVSQPPRMFTGITRSSSDDKVAPSSGRGIRASSRRTWTSRSRTKSRKSSTKEM